MFVSISAYSLNDHWGWALVTGPKPATFFGNLPTHDPPPSAGGPSRPEPAQNPKHPPLPRVDYPRKTHHPTKPPRNRPKTWVESLILWLSAGPD